jgi:hypothetical protein
MANGYVYTTLFGDVTISDRGTTTSSVFAFPDNDSQEKIEFSAEVGFSVAVGASVGVRVDFDRIIVKSDRLLVPFVADGC